MASKEFMVSLTLEEAESLVAKVSDLVGPGLITIKSQVTIVADDEKAGGILAILFDHQEKLAKKIKVPVASEKPISKPGPKARGNKALVWELLDDKREVIERLTNDEKNTRIEGGLFVPGVLLRYASNGTLRQVAGGLGQHQTLQPLGKAVQ